MVYVMVILVALAYEKDGEHLYKAIKIHRLVGTMFVPNDDPVNKTFLNHIDGNKFNNHYTNLEWVTPSDNVQHAVDTGLITITKRRVTQIDENDVEIKTFESIDVASKALGIGDSCIVRACKNNRMTGGFKWKYTDENVNEVELSDDELKNYIQVKDFPNYIINREGRVYSKPYKKFIKTLITRDGSSQLQLTDNTRRKTYLLHVLMAEHFFEKKPDDKSLVFHKNGNKQDN